MAHHRLALFLTRGFEQESHPHLLGARTAQSQLVSQVSTERARDEQQRLAVFDRLIELPMRAREEWWVPRHELIGLQPPREEHRMPAIAPELALELSRADRRHRGQRAKTQKINSLQLLHIKRKLARR